MEKGAKNLNKNFSKEDIQVANKDKGNAIHNHNEMSLHTH